MDRRKFVKILGLGIITDLAGCLENQKSKPESSGKIRKENGDKKDTDSPSYTPELPVPENELKRGVPRDAIPAITQPRFGEDWSEVKVRIYEPTLEADRDASIQIYGRDRVIGVERGGEARAYPLKILNYHEIVNDNFGIPLLVTFCPLCGSGIVAKRRVKGEETIFGVSGILWKSNLVMYDRKTDSLWSQVLAKAIRGEATGESLELIPSTMMTWGEWKRNHPDTRVLLPPPESGTLKGEISRNYNLNPYEGYENSRKIGMGDEKFEDDRLHPKMTVIGIRSDNVSRAYPLDRMKQKKVVNDVVGETPVVVAVGPGDTLVAYERDIGGELLKFEEVDEKVMESENSKWDITTGKAFDGRYEGRRLKKANTHSPMFWFAWRKFNPETEVYGE